MAFESYYWKKDIKRDVTYIEKVMDIKVTDLSDNKLDECISKIEIKLFLMAFSIRKLLESKRLPDIVKAKEINLFKYARNSTREGLTFNTEKLYDFNNPIKARLKLIDILNQFIHAHSFQVYSNRNGKLRFIEVTSDFTKRHHIHVLEIKKFLALINNVSKQQVKSILRTYDKNTGKITTVVK